MTLPMLKVGTTSNGMDSTVNLLNTLIVQLPWLKKKVFNQWPLTTASTMKTRMMLSLIKTLSSLTGLKDGGVTTFASPQYLASKGYKFLNRMEIGTTFSVKNQKMVVASSRKLLKILKKLHLTNQHQLNILTYLLLVVCQLSGLTDQAQNTRKKKSLNS